MVLVRHIRQEAMLVEVGTDLRMDNTLVGELDSFLIASERRRIALCKRRNPVKPFVVVVYIRQRGTDKEVVLSFSEYYTEEVARYEFENRRPKMRDSAGEEVPMQRGKRLVQEVMTDILGPSDKALHGSGI